MWKKTNQLKPHILVERISDLLLTEQMMPEICQLSTIGPLYSAALFNPQENAALIRESIYCGMDLDKEIAILKAFIEFVERMAFWEGQTSGQPSCQSQRSDGIAAFPVGAHGRRYAVEQSRKNALAEAIERYSWAKWWDDETISASITTIRDANLKPSVRQLVEAVIKITPMNDILLVKPIIDQGDTEVIILFGLLNNGGVTSGGACGSRSSETVMLRALGELARHTEAARRLAGGVKANTFYELRLQFMCRQDSQEILKRRLLKGDRSLTLPSLKWDEELPHKFGNDVVVYRCLFEDQPPFIGGALERFCL